MLDNCFKFITFYVGVVRVGDSQELCQLKIKSAEYYQPSQTGTIQITFLYGFHYMFKKYAVADLH